MNTSQEQASLKEKRRHPRIGTLNKVGYALFDEKGTKVDQGKGKTVNLSQSGALLETPKVLEGAFIILMTIDLDRKYVKVKGRILYSRIEAPSSRYLTGIEFIGSKDEQHQAIITFVKTYSHRKHSEMT